MGGAGALILFVGERNTVAVVLMDPEQPLMGEMTVGLLSTGSKLCRCLERESTLCLEEIAHTKVLSRECAGMLEEPMEEERVGEEVTLKP